MRRDKKAALLLGSLLSAGALAAVLPGSAAADRLNGAGRNQSVTAGSGVAGPSVRRDAAGRVPPVSPASLPPAAASPTTELAAGGATDSGRWSPSARPARTPAGTPGAPEAAVETAAAVDPGVLSGPQAAAGPQVAGCPPPRSGTVSQAPGTRRTVALTFDDGPSAYTAQLLAVLRDKHVHATFFVIGANVAGHRAEVARAAADGNLIGDHTWHHNYPSEVRGGWSASYLRRELTSTRTAVSAATGQPVCWFRPPGGNLPPSVLPTAHGLGFSVAMWSVDPKDWQLQGLGTTKASSNKSQLTAKILARVRTGLAQPHPLILMHDGGGYRGAGVAAVASIIDAYRAKGYVFVRLDGRA